jgi:protein Mpv17
MLPFLRRVQTSYIRSMHERPWTTNMVTGGALGLIGDVICQRSLEDCEQLDWRRMGALGVFGLVYSGGVNFAVYNSFSRVLPATLQTTPLRYGVGCTALDNFVHVPFLYTPAFYLSTGLLQGASLGESVDTMAEGYWRSISTCWLMWVPLQAVNFAFVPAHLRVAVV